MQSRFSLFKEWHTLTQIFSTKADGSELVTKFFSSLLLLLFLLIGTKIQSQSAYISVSSGNWSNTATWSPTGVPGATTNVTIASGHTVTLTAVVDITSGSLTVNGILELAGFNLIAGSLAGVGNIGSASGSPLVTVGSNGNSTTYSGIFSGNGLRLTKEGVGELTLSGNNTYSSATIISEGTLQLVPDKERISNSSVFNEANGVTFDMKEGIQSIGSLAGAVAGLILITLFLYSRKQKQKLPSNHQEKDEKNLRQRIEVMQRELNSQDIHLHSIIGFNNNILSRLAHIRDKVKGESAEELTKIISDFEYEMPRELWDDFRIRFEKVNEDFHQNLIKIAPDLTPVEIKIACFLKLNLSSKEISKLTNRSEGTISNTRTSLRKKLKLKANDNLVSFLMSL